MCVCVCVCVCVYTIEVNFLPCLLMLIKDMT